MYLPTVADQDTITRAIFKFIQFWALSAELGSMLMVYLAFPVGYALSQAFALCTTLVCLMVMVFALSCPCLVLALFGATIVFGSLLFFLSFSQLPPVG
ncbi:hypothetical protein U1Q18_023504 [Sarracenia purpurea var. burkii]